MKKTDFITPCFLKECLHYNDETGRLEWIERPLYHFKNERGQSQTNGRAAKPAFNTPHSSGYLYGAIGGHKFYAHRVAWAVFYGEWPDHEIDHINHDRTDNRIKNLRIAKRTDNGKNLSLNKSNKTGVNGVYQHSKSKKFIAQIRLNGKVIYLGAFSSIELAKEARLKADYQYLFHKNHGY